MDLRPPGDPIRPVLRWELYALGGRASLPIEWGKQRPGAGWSILVVKLDEDVCGVDSLYHALCLLREHRLYFFEVDTFNPPTYPRYGQVTWLRILPAPEDRPGAVVVHDPLSTVTISNGEGWWVRGVIADGVRIAGDIMDGLPSFLVAPTPLEVVHIFDGTLPPGDSYRVPMSKVQGPWYGSADFLPPAEYFRFLRETEVSLPVIPDHELADWAWRRHAILRILGEYQGRTILPGQQQLL